MNAVSQKRYNDIVVLEDSRAQRDLLVEILSEEKFRVRTGCNGIEGIGLIGESRPNLIISDVQMPGMDGHEFCKAVKKDAVFKDIPLILLTSLMNFEDVKKGLDAGADYYITKPFSKELLLSMVKTILSGGHGNETATAGEDIYSSRRTFNFLFSTYQNLLFQNTSLTQAKRDLGKMNAFLERRVEEKTESMRAMLNGTVIALSRMVEIRDPYTAGHQLRVAQLARAIGKRLGFSESRLDGMRIMGLLHDIGKCIVPAEILCKPSKLTDYEFNLIKEHSRAGYEILQGIEFPWPVADAVAQHHERLDGSGYPARIKGPEIVVEAKILAVSDVIESMMSHRPYRPALGIECALEEVDKHKGRFYEPVIVDIALWLFKEDSFTFES